MSAPLGRYPGGYHVVDFSERMTNHGAEASVVFWGPSQNRWNLLHSIFPQWTVTGNGTPTSPACHADLDNPPTPYPDLASTFFWPTDPQHPDYDPFKAGDVECGLFGSCLWPDTFTVARADQTCTPDHITCTNTAVPLSSPLYYGNGSQGDCAAEITVNYRFKHHQSWPNYMWPCKDTSDYWALPVIPAGTYIDVRQNLNVQTTWLQPQEGETAASLFTYKDDEEWRFKNNTVTPSSCSATSYGTLGTGAWCTTAAGTAVPVPRELRPQPLVFAQELEVRWSGLPLIPIAELEAARGKTNYTIFLNYPPESVMLSNYDIEPAYYFGCVQLYTLVLKFNVLTTGILGVETSTMTTEQKLVNGIWNNQIGLWNRIWSEEPIKYDDVATNHVPVKVKYNNCGLSASKSETGVYLPYCFPQIFQIP